MFKKDKGTLANRRKKKDDEDEKNEGDATAAASSTSSSSSSSSTTAAAAPATKLTAALIRIQKDLSDLELPSNVTLTKNDDYSFTLTIKVDSGYWCYGIYDFTVAFPKNYPFTGPKVLCVDKIYHPNIDLDGGVCVSVLRPWKPTYNLQQILFGLLFLFTDPNPNDPLNNDAAKDMRDNRTAFSRNVITAMKGGKVGTVQFPKNRGNVS